MQVKALELGKTGKNRKSAEQFQPLQAGMEWGFEITLTPQRYICTHIKRQTQRHTKLFNRAVDMSQTTGSQK